MKIPMQHIIFFGLIAIALSFLCFTVYQWGKITAENKRIYIEGKPQSNATQYGTIKVGDKEIPYVSKLTVEAQEEYDRIQKELNQ
jgi:hypothetical protein